MAPPIHHKDVNDSWRVNDGNKAFWLLVKHTRQQKLIEANPGHIAMGSLQSSALDEAEKNRD